MKENVVIYHANCYDGVTAAWVCCKKFGDNAEYIPMNYSDPLMLSVVQEKNVYIVDFSFKRETCESIKSVAKSLVILDHHATAQEALAGLDYAIFDMNRSGAGIAWDYFFPKQDRSFLVNYVEDRDLWRFGLAGSKEINAFIQSFDIDLNTWIKEVAPAVEHMALGELLGIGQSLLRMQNKLVKSIASNARIKTINDTGLMGPYVATSVLMSEVCDQMLKDHPEYDFSWYSFQRKDGKYQYGLRSRSDFDVSEIAKKFRGGGHKQAAGFELDYQL